MKRIALAGGASCGKTSLARHLTTELYNNQTPKRNAQHIPEFARDHINECRRMDGTFIPTMATQQMFFYEQMAREDALDSSEVEFLITDSPIFLTVVYAWPLVTPRSYSSRVTYEKLYDTWLQQYARYDHVFLLAREKAFFQDGTRGGSAEGAMDMHERIWAFLCYHEISFTEVRGHDLERVAQVLQEIL